jgi:hypothetical protein
MLERKIRYLYDNILRTTPYEGMVILYAFSQLQEGRSLTCLSVAQKEIMSFAFDRIKEQLATPKE